MTIYEEINAEIDKLPPDERKDVMILAYQIAAIIQKAGFPKGPMAFALVGAILEKRLAEEDETPEDFVKIRSGES